MNKQEATQLLALIKVAYPEAYRDMDEASKKATVNMWAMSFPDVPYPIMEQALNHFRMVSKFAPKVAEMVEELRNIHYRAKGGALLAKTLGDQDRVEQYRMVMSYTSRYKDTDSLGGLNIGSLAGRLGGADDVQRLGASRDRMDREDRPSLVDAGGWGDGSS